MFLNKGSTKDVNNLIITCLVAWIWLPLFFTSGMFVDGITYGAISHNLSQDLGSFFVPHYTATLHPKFFEHPPLVFILQKFFFDLFGSSLFTENIFSAVQLIISIWLFKKLEKLLFGSGHWLSTILFLTTPLVIWGYSNNLLESTLIVFCTASVVTTVQALNNKSPLRLYLSSLFIFAAFLSKGPVGLFPLVAPMLWTVTHRGFSFKKGIISQFHLLLGLLLSAAISFYLWPELWQNLKSYFSIQLLPALSGNREVTTSFRGSILLNLVVQLLIPIALLLAAWIFSKRVKLKTNPNLQFLLILALCASLPLMVSSKQRDFYTLPSIVLFLLYFSQMARPIVDNLKWNFLLNPWVLRGFFLAAFAGVIYSTSMIGSPRRDGDLQSDVVIISSVVGTQTTIATNTLTWNDWTYQAYFMRLAQISLDDQKPARFMLLPKGFRGETKKGQQEYRKVPLELHHFDLYEMVKSP